MDTASAPALGQPVAVTAFFTVEGRCFPRTLVVGGDTLQVLEVLRQGREGSYGTWLVRTPGGITAELLFDPTSLRWYARRLEAMV